MTNPGAGSPSSSATTGTVRVAEPLELDAKRARHHLCDLHAIRRSHFFVANGKQPGARTRLLEIEHRDNVTGLQAAEQRRRTAQPDLDAVGRVANHFEVRWDVAEFQRHAEDALDDVLARHRQPQETGEDERDELEPEVPEGMVSHQAS